MNIPNVLKFAIKHRRALASVCGARVFVEDIRAVDLKKAGAKAVILDFDGVLGASRALLPDQTGKTMIEDMLKVFGAGKVFVLSNTTSVKNSREKAISSAMPDLIYIRAEKKPATGGLLIASKLSSVPAKDIAVIDDGVLTGVAMAFEAGAMPYYCVRRAIEEGAKSKIIRLTTTAAQTALLRLVTAIRWKN